MALFDGLFKGRNKSSAAAAAASLFRDDSNFKRPSDFAYSAAQQQNLQHQPVAKAAEPEPASRAATLGKRSRAAPKLPVGKQAPRAAAKSAEAAQVSLPPVAKAVAKAAPAAIPARNSSPPAYGAERRLAKRQKQSAGQTGAPKPQQRQSHRQEPGGVVRQPAVPAQCMSAPAAAAEEADQELLHESLQSTSKQRKSQPTASQRSQTEKPVLSREEEEEQLSRTVFVGNLPAAVRPKAVRRIFRAYGAVQAVRVRSVPLKLDSKLPRRAAVMTGAVAEERGSAHAYVRFADRETAAAALAHNMQEVEGHHIVVNSAAKKSGEGKPAGVEYNPARSVFVGNLHFDTQDEELISLFNALPDPQLANAVTAVRVVRDGPTNIGKGFAFVQFRSKPAARAALALEGSRIRNRPIRVTRVATNIKLAPAAKKAAGKVVSTPRGSAAGPRAVSKPSGQESWMGLQTKGKSGAVRGPSKPPRPQKGAPSAKPAAAAIAAQRPAGKRPAVAMRKARSLAQGGRGGGQAVQGVKVKKPRWVPRTGKPSSS